MIHTYCVAPTFRPSLHACLTLHSICVKPRFEGPTSELVFTLCGTGCRVSVSCTHTRGTLWFVSLNNSVCSFSEKPCCAALRGIPRHAVQPNRVFIPLERFHQRGDANSFSSSCQTSLHLLLLLLLPPGSFPLPLIFSLLLPPSLRLSSLSLLHLYMNSLIAYTSFLLPFFSPKSTGFTFVWLFSTHPLLFWVNASSVIAVWACVCVCVCVCIYIYIHADKRIERGIRGDE